MTKLRRNLAIVPALALALGGAARGQGGSDFDGFTVAGKGTVNAKPNRLEIEVEISAASEMTADVIVKYRDAKKRLQDAFVALKMPNVGVDEKALAVDQKTVAFNPYTMDTPASRRGKVEVQLTRKLIIRADKIRDLDEEALLTMVAKLLDVAQDAGAKVGTAADPMRMWYYGYGNNDNGLVKFILDDFEAVEEKAYQAAVDDARGRAKRLAKLNGVELGPVAGVRETSTPGEKGQANSGYSRFGGDANAAADDEPKRQITTAKFQEIPVRVELLVRFATAARPIKVGDAK